MATDYTLHAPGCNSLVELPSSSPSSRTPAPEALANLTTWTAPEGPATEAGHLTIPTTPQGSSHMPEIRMISRESAPSADDQAPPLDKYANNSRKQADPGASARLKRWTAMQGLWDFTTLGRVMNCRRVRADSNLDVELRVGEEGLAGFSNLQTCGSVWACPLCSSRILATRRDELTKLVHGAVEQEMAIGFATKTIRHHKGQSLSELLTILSKAQQAVGRDRAVRAKREELGFVGYVRRLEITHGSNGWHPHYHELQLFETDVTEAQLQELHDLEFRAFQKRAINMGVAAPLPQAQDSRLVRAKRQKSQLNPEDKEQLDIEDVEDIIDYMSKGTYNGLQEDENDTSRDGETTALKLARVKLETPGIAHEMASDVTKKGKRGSRTPFEILTSVVETGDCDDLSLWHEFEQASRGKRLMTWSRGLKQMFGIGEVTDEDAAAEETADRKMEKISLDWDVLAMSGRAKVGGMLINAARSHGIDGAIELCHELGVDWWGRGTVGGSTEQSQKVRQRE